MAGKLIDGGFASDSEIYDLILASPKKLNTPKLRSLASSNGIFISPDDDRESVAEYLSMAIRDYDSVCELVEASTPAVRAEKKTSVEFDTEISKDEIQNFFEKYRDETKSSENVRLRSPEENTSHLDVEYQVFDHSRTKLMQKTRKDARIEFHAENGKTIVRMPANDKTDGIIENLTNTLKTSRGSEVVSEKLNLADLSQANRTQFFKKLFFAMPGLAYDDVTDVKVSKGMEAEQTDIDEDHNTERAGEVVAALKRVTMSGTGLLNDKIFTSLEEDGFFISGATFVVRQKKSPYTKFRIDVGFRESSDMTGFRYGVKKSLRSEDLSKYQSYVRVSAVESNELSKVLEKVAKKIKKSLLKSQNPKSE